MIQERIDSRYCLFCVACVLIPRTIVRIPDMYAKYCLSLNTNYHPQTIVYENSVIVRFAAGFFLQLILIVVFASSQIIRRAIHSCSDRQLCTVIRQIVGPFTVSVIVNYTWLVNK